MRVCVQVRARPPHPYKAGGEPSLLLVDLAPPPVLVGGVQHLDDVAGLKRQLPVGHGHMVPYRLGVDDRAPTYQLRKYRRERRRERENRARALSPFHSIGCPDQILIYSTDKKANCSSLKQKKPKTKQKKDNTIIQFAGKKNPILIIVFLLVAKQRLSKPGPTGGKENNTMANGNRQV